MTRSDSTLRGPVIHCDTCGVQVALWAIQADTIEELGWVTTGSWRNRRDKCYLCTIGGGSRAQ